MDSLLIGKSLDGKEVCIPLNTLVLHGLIGGSTGTGKTRSIQVLAEELNDEKITVLLADLKGDIGGFIEPNLDPSSKKRANDLKLNFKSNSFSTDFFSVNGSFIPLRLELEQIDPVLLSRILKLNDTQESNLRLAYSYAKEKNLPLRDFIDLKNLLVMISKDSTAAGASSSSIDVILMQITISISEGMNELFGEPSISSQDILNGKINVLNLSNYRSRSDMPAILMGFILYRLFQEFPDVGSLPKPKIVLFIDEAHYLFSGSNSSLINLFASILKQIRSKGIGVFFSTQNPQDIPQKILEQLGCKIQFALRAFTSKDLDAINGIAKAFPPTKMDLSAQIRNLEVGCAIIAPLDEKGKPLLPVKTQILPPRSSMGVPDNQKIIKTLDQTLLTKYSQTTALERYEYTPTLQIKFSGKSISGTGIRGPWGGEDDVNYVRRETFRVNKQWNRMKLIGVFIIVIIVLIIVILLIFAFLFK